MLTEFQIKEIRATAAALKGYADINWTLGNYTESINEERAATSLELLLSMVVPDPICKKCGIDMNTLPPGTVHRTPGCEAGKFWASKKS